MTRAWQRSQEGVELVADQMVRELMVALDKFPRVQASPHEMYAVLLEEVDELWDEVKGKRPDRNQRMIAEAIQVGAMAIRFILDATETVGADWE